MRSWTGGFDMDRGVGGRGSGVRTSTALVVDRTPDTQPLTPSSRVRPQTMAGLAWWRFTRHRMAGAGLLVVAVLGAASALASWGSPYDPDKPDLQLQLRAPSPGHLLGTDDLGRDLPTRILYGGRVSLSIGVLAMTLAVLMGTAVGAAAGYYGGAIDNLLMRFTDLMLSIPALFLLILLILGLRRFPLPFFWGGGLATGPWA